MPQRTWIVAVLIAFCSGCATAPTPPAEDPACGPELTRPVYLDIQDFQQALNNATRDLRGNWQVGVDTVFRRLDGVIAERQRAAKSPTCPGANKDLADQLNRLRIVRARGEEYLAQLHARRKADEAVLAKLGKSGITEARLGDIRVRLSGINDCGQSFTLKLRNLGTKAHTLVTHYEPGIDRPDSPVMSPGYFLLSDEFGTVYPLATISPAFPPQAPLTLAPGRYQQLRVSFSEPYPQQIRRLTLHIDPNLISSDPQRLQRAPAALVLSAELIPRTAQPRFIAEPGPGGAKP